jgi:hypothetical protein
LQWLADVQRTDKGCFAPIGSNGFYPRGRERARFEQGRVMQDFLRCDYLAVGEVGM